MRVPWKGTLTVHPRVQQKLIRVVSSAAVCGLSFSFIIGEAVDQKAKSLALWEVNPALLPAHYAPTAPILQAYSNFPFLRAQETWVAINSFQPGQLPDPAPMPTFQDSLKTILASTETNSKVETAPKLEAVSKTDSTTPSASSVTSQQIAAGKDEVIIGETFGPEEKNVQQILTSIQDARSQLAPPEMQNDRAVISSGNVMVKLVDERNGSQAIERTSDRTIEGASDKTETQSPISSQDQVIIGGGTVEPAGSQNGSSTNDSSSSVVAVATKPNEKESQSSKDWIVQGRVLANSRIEKGHFEIGAFAKIDQDGMPVGYPAAQKILPNGVTEFSLKIPKKLDRAYLFGEFVSNKSGKRTLLTSNQSVWNKNQNGSLEFRFGATDTVSSIAAAATGATSSSGFETGKMKISGTVSTLFVKSGAIPQEDVVVKVRGRKEATRTDSAGNFQLEVPAVNGTIYLEFLKAGYHPSLYSIRSRAAASGIKVQIASRDAVEQLARRLGHRQLTAKGVYFGKVTKSGVAVKGATVQMSLKAEGPYYFNDDGVIDRQLKSSSGDGRFIFFNVDPGTGVVEVGDSGEMVAPFSLSVVEGGELSFKELSIVAGSIKGRIFNPVDGRGKLLPISGARMKIEGSSEWTNSDSYGAFHLGPLKMIKGEPISLEYSSEKYNNHRYLVYPNEDPLGLNLFAFPANYLGRLAQSMDIDLDSTSGIVMGKVSNLSVRIDALADHSPVNSAKDFYFDSKGKLRGSHTSTDSRYGTYIIFNVPKGRALLQGIDSTGSLRYSESVVTSGATISVIMD